MADVKEPSGRCNGTMTESQYLAWIRSALRSKSLTWPPRAEAMKLARRPYKGPNRLQKWQYMCSICGQWGLGKHMVVDHHPIAAGSILKWQDIGAFANNLFCEVDNLRVLDKTCHDIHTLAEKKGIGFEEARALKKAIEFLKQDSAVVVKYLAKLGYSPTETSNASKRRILIEKHFKEEA